MADPQVTPARDTTGLRARLKDVRVMTAPRPWLLALLALGPALAGCLAGQETGSCQVENVLPVAWHQPGLYEAVPIDDPVNGWTFEQDEPEPGLPFQSGAWDDAVGYQGYALTRVTWSSDIAPEPVSDGPRVGSMDRFELSRDGRLTATLPGNVTQAQAREAFMTFTGSVTEAGQDQRERWLEAFMEPPSPSGPRVGDPHDQAATRHQVHLDAPLTTDALVGDPPVPGQPQRVTDPGAAEITYGDWIFRIEVPERSVPVPPGTRLARSISVDALDRVHVQVWQVPDHGPALQGVLVRLFHEAGLPAPDIATGALAVPDGCQARYELLAQHP